MSLIPGDIVTDADVAALDTRVLSEFGDDVDIASKREVALQHWLAPRLERRGLQPHEHKSRRTADAVYGQISSVTTSYASEADSVTVGDIPLGTIFTGGDATDSLYVMLQQPYRGLYVGMHETVNAATSISSVMVWTGQWSHVNSLIDGTMVNSAPLARGGVISWRPSDVWQQRRFEDAYGYWSKIYIGSLTATTVAAQLVPVVASRLTYPLALYTLGLVYEDAWRSGRGDWGDKSERMMDRAGMELDRVLPLIADEFDVDKTGTVGPTEVNSAVRAAEYEQAFVWERG